MGRDQNSGCCGCSNKWPKRYVAVAAMYSGVNFLIGQKFESCVAVNLVYFLVIWNRIRVETTLEKAIEEKK